MPNTSWIEVMLGSLTTFAIVLTLGILVGILAVAIQAALGTAGATGGEAWGLVGASLTLLLAFFLGGYVAGRTGRRSGINNGLLALVAAMFLAVVGAMFGPGLVNGLSGARFPSSLEDIQNLGTTMTVSGVLALILPFVGGALGGARGANMERGRRL